MSHQPDNVFAGTQVVSLVEVRGTNNSLVHPRGAVGVVTRTPTGQQNQFLVRFPDGFEASFTRDKLEVLKHFKDRFGEAAGVGPSITSPNSRGNEALISSECRIQSEERDQSLVTSAATQDFDLEEFIIYRCV